MIGRAAEQQVKDNARWYPIVSVTGPRQSGKSTLVRAAFPDYEYVNLELPSYFDQASDDPVGFIRSRPHHLIVDEAQRVPELFNVIQVESDENGSAGQYVLSGSQNFLMRQQITQSLAGRVGIVKLLPLSLREARSAHPELSPEEFCFRGGYPRLYDRPIPPANFYRNYVATYLSRDVAGYVNASNLATFETFLHVCADASGKLLNVSRIANDVGVSTRTVRSWLSLLESSYVVFLLQPFHANMRKRLTKTPKLYFYDSGLLCYLLGIGNQGALEKSAHRGAVFENLVIAETLKRHLNFDEDPVLYFYRDDSKIEVDLLDFTKRDEPELVEVKSSQTYRSSYTRNLYTVSQAIAPGDGARLSLVMRPDASSEVGAVKVWSLEDWLLR